MEHKMHLPIVLWFYIFGKLWFVHICGEWCVRHVVFIVYFDLFHKVMWFHKLIQTNWFSAFGYSHTHEKDLKLVMTNQLKLSTCDLLKVFLEFHVLESLRLWFKLTNSLLKREVSLKVFNFYSLCLFCLRASKNLSLEVFDEWVLCSRIEYLLS